MKPYCDILRVNIVPYGHNTPNSPATVLCDFVGIDSRPWDRLLFNKLSIFENANIEF